MADSPSSAKVSFLTIGRQPPVRVLLHGFGSNAGTFQRLIPHLRWKGSLVLVDLPGHGRSSRPGAGPAPDRMAQAIAERLGTLGLERFELIGHSLGGLVATRIAGMIPVQVTKLSLISCAGVGPDLNMDFFRAFAEARSSEDLAALLALAYARAPQDLPKVGRTVLTWLEQPGIRSYVREIVNSAETFAADFAVPLAKGIPIKALWGAQDRIAPVKNALSLPDTVPLTIMNEAGHVPHIEAPAAVARWLLEEPTL